MPPEAYRPAKSSLEISRETDLFFFQTLTAEELRLCFSPSDPPPLFHLPMLLLSNSLPPITPLARLLFEPTPQTQVFALVRVREIGTAISVTSGDSEEERVVVLVISGGGREHALCHALKRSPSQKDLVIYEIHVIGFTKHESSEN